MSSTLPNSQLLSKNLQADHLILCEIQSLVHSFKVLHHLHLYLHLHLKILHRPYHLRYLLHLEVLLYPVISSLVCLVHHCFPLLKNPQHLMKIPHYLLMHLLKILQYLQMRLLRNYLLKRLHRQYLYSYLLN